jgi:AraC-like DNA-binding protein
MFTSFGLAIKHGHMITMPSPHQHNEIELNFIERGSVTYLFSGKRYQLTAQRLCLFWAAAPHQTVEVDPQTVFFWMTIPLVWFLRWNLPSRFTTRVLQGNPIQETDPAAAALDALSFARWHEDWPTGGTGSEAFSQLILLEAHARLLRLALSASAADSLKEPHPLDEQAISKVEQMAAIIAQRYLEPIQIADIAEAVKLHPKYAMQTFKRTFGLSLIDYLTQHRLAHAQRLLVTTDLKVVDVAMEAGFGSLSRFYAVFMQEHGQTPRAYRHALGLTKT